MIGRTLLHYEILAELGTGAMGNVYLARDIHTDRRVALKFLGGVAVPDGEARDRLMREARAAARLSHPGIVALHAVEEAEGRPFLIHEYVEGDTLARRLEQGPLGTQETRRLARELAAALEHAHRQGVLHRDLKPENILIAADGSFKIADFGIARLEGTPTLTAVGTVVGTLAYMAPERLRGARGDARADLFSLGAILYEAMSGRRAFGGSNESELIYKVLNEDPAPLEAASPSLENLAQLVTKLLAKEPQQRPASAEVVAGILHGLEATQARGGPAGRRRPWIAAGIVLLVFAAAAIFWRMRSPQVGEAHAQPAVAVLYFENLADPEDRGRIGSITGNLLVTSLAQTADLNVLSTQRILDAMRQIGKRGARVDRDLAIQIAKRAQAHRIVTGSILQTEPHIVMTAEVSDVGTGRVLQAVRIEGEPGQTVFQVVDALSGQLMQKMVAANEAVRLQPVAQRSSADLGAQRSYAAGLEQLSNGQMEEAQRSFADAVGRDPQFAQAHYQAAIAEWWGSEPMDAVASIQRAKEHSERLSPMEREVVRGLEALVQRSWTEAKERFIRLAATYPQEKLIHYGLVEAAYHSHDWARAIEAGRRALELDPDFTLAGVHVVDALQKTGQLDEAEVTARRLLRKNDKNALLWQSLFLLMTDRAEGQAALRVAEEARAAGAVGGFLPAAAEVLSFNLNGPEAARPWLIPPDSLPWRREDLRLGLAYDTAIRGGRFRDGIGIARRAWKVVPISHVPGGPPVPIAVGLDAAVGARDVAQAMVWSDSITVRVQRWIGPSGEILASLFRVELQVDLGLKAEAAASLRRLEARPEVRMEANEPFLRYTQALVATSEGRPREALELLRGAGVPAPWLSTGLKRMAQARAEMAAGLDREALGHVDSLMRAPMLSADEAVRLHFYRGQVLERLERPTEAAASYREFLTLWRTADPGTPEVDEARAALRRLERAGQAARRP